MRAANAPEGGAVFTVDLPLRHEEAGEPADDGCSGPPDDAWAADDAGTAGERTADDDRGGTRSEAGKETHA